MDARSGWWCDKKIRFLRRWRGGDGVATVFESVVGSERSGATIRNSIRAKARMDVTVAARERRDDGTDDDSFIRSFPFIARS